MTWCSLNRWRSVGICQHSAGTLYPPSTGLGFALSYTPAIAMVGRYFNERKTLAYGISMSGTDFNYLLFISLCYENLNSNLFLLSLFLLTHNSLLFFSLFLSFFLIFCLFLFFLSSLVSFHPIWFWLISRQRHRDLPSGSCSSAADWTLLLERGNAHSWGVCFQPVCLWCSDEATGTKEHWKVSLLLW